MKKFFKNFSPDLRYLLLVRYRRPLLYEWALAVKNRLYGQKVRLDASAVCQLKCPACSTASGKNKKGVVGRGHLKLKHFKKLLRENPSIKSVELSNWGEIFLNPQIDDIIKFAHKRGVRLSAANGVNLNTVRDETLRVLVKFKFRFLSVSIDGASQDTYKLYRIGGDFDRVIANIKRINHFKTIYRTRFPHLAWQFVVFGHNEHELPAGRQMADDLGMKFKPKLNHTPTHSPVQDPIWVSQESRLGASSREDFREKKKREYSWPCMQLWKNPQINWDGKLLGCCVNKWDNFGNVFQDGFQSTINSERYFYAKQMVLGRKPAREDIPCSKCKVYHRRLSPVSDVSG